jgi:hypothetical protein
LENELESALSPKTIRNGGGVAYLDNLTPSKQKYDEAYKNAVQDGQELVELFSRPPVEPQNPLGKISQHLKEVEGGKRRVDAMWAESWRRGQNGSSGDNEATHPSDGGATPSASEDLEPVEPVGVVSKVTGVNQANVNVSDRFSELEEEAYEVRWVWLQGKGHGM